MKYLSLTLTLLVLLWTLPLTAYAQPLEPLTVYDETGEVIYTEDASDTSLFLQKPFQEYTVTEGFLLLFLLLAFCWAIWKIIKGVL